MSTASWIDTKPCSNSKNDKPWYRINVRISDSDLTLENQTSTGLYSNIIKFWKNVPLESSSEKPDCLKSLDVFKNFLRPIFTVFGVNIDDRLLSLKAEVDNISNPSYIDLQLMINNNTSSPIDTYKYNNLSNRCLAKWFFQWFKVFNPINQATWTPNWVQNNPPPKCNDDFTPDVTTENYMNTTSNRLNDLPNSLLNFKFSNIELYEGDTLIENFSDITSAADPNSIIDYLFMYSVIFSFIGAMAYTIMSALQIDPFNIIANRNIVIAINVYFGLCGFLSFIVWCSFDTSFLYSGWFKRNWFNIDVIKLSNSG